MLLNKEITNQIIEAYYHRSKIVAFIYFVTCIALLRTFRNQLFMLFKGIPNIIVIIVYGAITVFCLPLVEKLVGALFSKS
ncbi:hypothetical protein F5ESL0245_00780 [Lactobacillus sp. ESL0245]|nr:hypothetical protein F5ESL0247_00780 [Lactobacillus sp. ESL0247]RMC29532.1 hypothetical protein F5ESL0246_00780 [Lactobacillus sp. ESL0246]RMC33521.1 hypothetical protein F5ESL0245_00780 [Lactobacillus sp. ESL0245]